MFSNLKSKHLRIPIVAIGLAFIVMSLLQAIFKLELDPNFDKEFSTTLFIIGAGLFVWMRQLRKAEDAKAAEDARAKAATPTEGTALPPNDRDDAKSD